MMGNTGGKRGINKDISHLINVSERKNLTRVDAKFDTGHHEAEICYGGEADLHKHYTGCKKNPGHINFIPVDDFNLDHLPSRYRDVIMLEVIKTLSALTVMIKVKYTSLERPKSITSLSGQYPFYNTRGSNVLRTGTGRVWRVDKHTESDNDGTCPCGKCQHSDTPSKVWGEICVLTATHVVFDASEARQTRCVVGFDDNKSPGVSLDGWNMKYEDTEKDFCLFTCVSCDLELVDELGKMWRHFRDLCGKVKDKYEGFDDVDKLTVIVSHPHGCPKQVSVGQWTHKHERDFLWIRYTYTTDTCPGSSGAYVYTPEKYAHFGHIHSGSNSTENYSTTHVVFDVSEARQTRCVVGFDDNKSPGVSLDGWGAEGAHIEGDKCLFTCVSCDLELVDELDKMCRHFKDLCGKVCHKYWRFVGVDKLTVIVSHPHGCPKQVSVGQWTHEHKRQYWYKYTYTTCTCPGSSGALIYIPGYERWWSHPHSGSNSEGNFCGEDGLLLY